MTGSFTNNSETPERHNGERTRLHRGQWQRKGYGERQKPHGWRRRRRKKSEGKQQKPRGGRWKKRRSSKRRAKAAWRAATAEGERQRKVAEEQPRGPAFADTLWISQSAFDHAFRRDRARRVHPFLSPTAVRISHQRHVLNFKALIPFFFILGHLRLRHMMKVV
jgi:hypothetical protein